MDKPGDGAVAKIILAENKKFFYALFAGRGICMLSETGLSIRKTFRISIKSAAKPVKLRI
jgi:hypothetical protein